MFNQNNNLIEFHFNYDAAFCQIKVSNKIDINDNLLIASYLLFVARYFLICDDRQIKPMRELLLKEIWNDKDEPATQKIYKVILNTLSQNERDAIGKLFLLGMPPLFYSTTEDVTKSYAKYSFSVIKNNEELRTVFNMSVGPDKILLPLTVGIFYEFIMNTLGDKGRVELLNYIIIKLLKSYEFSDCRSLTDNIRLPNEILRQNNISVSERN